MDFNSGWLEAGSTFSMFHIMLTDSISSHLKGTYAELDQTIELFINPKNLVFTEKELIDTFQYPTDDLHQIDMDNY
jgi:hypothetical protein